jgi:hypothetical protein
MSWADFQTKPEHQGHMPASPAVKEGFRNSTLKVARGETTAGFHFPRTSVFMVGTAPFDFTRRRGNFTIDTMSFPGLHHIPSGRRHARADHVYHQFRYRLSSLKHRIRSQSGETNLSSRVTVGGVTLRRGYGTVLVVLETAVR